MDGLFIGVIYLIAIVVAAALAYWAVRAYGPESIHEPARLIIGGLALIAILYVLWRVLVPALPALPMLLPWIGVS
jgi:uncharacterized membrane protein YdjX (TVP38/TMEM64 family)